VDDSLVEGDDQIPTLLCARLHTWRTAANHAAEADTGDVL